MRVIDVAARRQPPSLEISVSPAYELLMSLCVFGTGQSEQDIFEVGASWFENAQHKASDELKAAIAQFGAYNAIWVHLVGLVYDTPAPRDVPTFLAHIEQTSAVELRLYLFGYYMSTTHSHISPEILRGAAEGQPDAVQQLVQMWSSEHGHHDQDLVDLAALDPEQTKQLVLDILRGWYQQVFQEQEADALVILERDAEAKRRLAPTVPVECSVDVATNGIQYVPEAGFRRVILIPVVIYRPWVVTSEHRDARVFCYPVADESLSDDIDAPPVHLIKLYAALADDRRLRVLKKLANEACTLQELADFLGIAKSTMHHHLAILRGAGLLSLETNSKRYTLRRETLPDTTSILDAYLRPGVPEPATGPKE